MKKFLIILVLLAVAFIAVKLSIKSPDQSIPSATENANTTSLPADDSVNTNDQTPGEDRIATSRISTQFTGYGPGGKIEHGTVKAQESSLLNKNGVFSGGVVFDMSTIADNAAKAKLETHLKSSEFFDVAKYPTAAFTITSATTAQIKGNLTMKGITKPITLPVTKTADGSYTSTVRVNMEDFGIKQTFTDKEFVLTITVK
jgi:polyisoprenoid-binding protein YceI